jgi:hypothetical protein
MSPLLILILILIFLGGGGGYYGYNRYGGSGLVGVLVLVVLAFWLFGRGLR